MNSSMRRTILSAAITAITLLPAARALSQAQPDSAAPLGHTGITAPVVAPTSVPVKHVILFSSGVGYFEHDGQVDGDAAAELSFKTDQINDVLKSLVVQDLSGGHVGAVSYPSQDPLARTLKSFGVDISKNPPLIELLKQLRGATVDVRTTGGQSFTGSILGVESRIAPAPTGQTPVAIPILSILTDASIRQIDLNQLDQLTLQDKRLQTELNKALAAVAQARDNDRKPVTITLHGDGARDVRIGYVVAAPIWKTSYRLLLTSDRDNPAASGATLQGWAIVENQTDNDWKDVDLTLVSGRPISFVEDLYQPLYLPRPTVTPELYAGLRPPVDYGATAAAAPMAEQAAPTTFGYRTFTGGAPRDNSTMAEARNYLQGIAPSPIASAAAGRLGELFQYSVGNVTLQRQSGAMLPIVSDSIQVQRVSLYNQSTLARYPLNSVRLTNTTGKQLPAGPVTVLDSGSYAGDAQLDNLPQTQQRLLSFGIDLQMPVDAQQTNPSEGQVRTARIEHGILIITRKFVATTKFSATNKSDHDKLLIIEQPRRGGWELVDSPKPMEVTDDQYRFSQPVLAGKTAELSINEQLVNDEQVALLQAAPEQIDVYYAKTGNIPKPVRDALAKAMDLKRALADTDQQIGDNNLHTEQITADQDRMRENMRAVEHNSSYYQRLLKKLDAQEDQLETLIKQRTDLANQRDHQLKALADYIANLSV